MKKNAPVDQEIVEFARQHQDSCQICGNELRHSGDPLCSVCGHKLTQLCYPYIKPLLAMTAIFSFNAGLGLLCAFVLVKDNGGSSLLTISLALYALMVPVAGVVFFLKRAFLKIRPARQRMIAITTMVASVIMFGLFLAGLANM